MRRISFIGSADPVNVNVSQSNGRPPRPSTDRPIKRRVIDEH
jgi:hypothetical protein